MRPSAGKVLFDGKVLTDLPERELTRPAGCGFGFLFQGAALFDSLSGVRHNVAFGLRTQGSAARVGDPGAG